MRITIQASGYLKDQIPGPMVVEDVATAGEALTALAVSVPQGLAIIINGRLARWNAPLHDGDVVQLAPAPGGG